MSDLRVEKNLFKYANRKNKYQKLIKVIIFLTILMFLVFGFTRYKTKILGIMLSGKDYSIKAKNISFFGSINATNMSMNIFNKTIDIEIFAKKVTPNEDGNILNLSFVKSTMKSKKDGYTFFLQSPNGSIKDEKYLTLYENTSIYDKDDNNAKFDKLECDMKSGEIIGKNPIIFSMKDYYSYNLSALNLKYNTKSNKVILNTNVSLIANNTKTNQITKANADMGEIDIIEKIFILYKNVKVEHMKYVLNADMISVDFTKSETKIQKDNKIKTEINMGNENAMFSSDVKRVLAKGNVSLEDAEMHITSKNAEYFGYSGDIVFTDAVKIVEKGKILFAHSVIYNVNSGKSKIISKNTMRLTNLNDKSESRIKIVFE